MAATPTPSGQMRQRVDLYDVPQATSDSFGQTSQARTFIGRFPAKITMLNGAEKINIRQVKQVYAEATHQVELGYLGASVFIKPRMEFDVDTPIGTRRLNIISADNTWDEQLMWVCICKEDVEANP